MIAAMAIIILRNMVVSLLQTSAHLRLGEQEQISHGDASSRRH
jgi:hypothetical protein